MLHAHGLLGNSRVRTVGWLIVRLVKMRNALLMTA